MSATTPAGGQSEFPHGSHLPGVHPLAPVFISYRTSDGSGLASALAWALRATGVPVWHDVTDQPPGDTRRRLEEAMTSGLSGAALLVSPDIENSAVVREIEVPNLLLLEPDPAFVFAIGSTVDSGSNLATIDRLLGQPPGTLQRFKHYPLVTDDDVAVLASAIAAQRMSAVREAGTTDFLLDIQTRLDPRGTPPQVPLAVRTRPPARGRRAPGSEIWPPFAAFLRDLPRLLSIAGAQTLRIRGGAHLTVAFALGAAVPTTSRWPVTVEDQAGAIWGRPGSPQPARRHPALLERSGGAERLPDTDTNNPAASESTSQVAIHVDLAPTPAPGDAFASHVAAHRRYARVVRLELARRTPIHPDAATFLATDLARRIKAAAASAVTNRVHLFLRVPFPLAVLLGRTLNTLEVTLYEWEDAHTVPQYLQTVTVASGRGHGPIVKYPRDPRTD